MTIKKISILLFLSLGTSLSIGLSYFGWKDVYTLFHYPEREFMYEPLLLISYADFTLLTIMGSISILSFLMRGRLWVPVIKCIIVNVGLWMLLAVVISAITLIIRPLLGIMLITIFGIFISGLLKLWNTTNLLNSECNVNENNSI